MKKRHVLNASYLSVLVGVWAGAAMAQEATNAAAAQTASDRPPPLPLEPTPEFAAKELEELAGSIALYPDPLVAQILPASTFPTDIVLAARALGRGMPETEIDAQPWDASVKALARYPSIIKMMDERLDWTSRLGEAFVRDPEGLMDAVQRLRTKARALGNLPDTPEQTVIVEREVEREVVRIVPTVTEVVYVPTYDPAVIYVRPCYNAWAVSPWISFGVGYRVGTWLNLDCDWYSYRCYYPSTWTWCNYPHSYWHSHGWGRPAYGVSFSWYWGGHSHYDHHHGYHGRHYSHGGHHGWRGHDDHGHRSHDRYGRSNDTSPRSWDRDSSRLEHASLRRSKDTSTSPGLLEKSPTLADRTGGRRSTPTSREIENRLSTRSTGKQVDSVGSRTTGRDSDSLKRTTGRSTPGTPSTKSPTTTEPGRRVKENTITAPRELDRTTIRRSPSQSTTQRGERLNAPQTTPRASEPMRAPGRATVVPSRRSSPSDSGVRSSPSPSRVSAPSRSSTSNSRPAARSSSPSRPSAAPSSGRQGLNRATAPSQSRSSPSSSGRSGGGSSSGSGGNRRSR